MPLYEYICQTCGERFEKLIRSQTASATVICPNCASEAVRRALSTFTTGGGAIERTSPACGPVG